MRDRHTIDHLRAFAFGAHPDQLRTATADIEHQSVRSALIDQRCTSLQCQPRLFLAGNRLNREAQFGFDAPLE